MRPVWRALLAGLVTVVAAPAEVYTAGLMALYGTFDPQDPAAARPQVRRDERYPWYYQVPADWRLGDLQLRARSEAPWPAEVLQQVNHDSMLVCWVGLLFVPRAGGYEFQLLADDFAALSLDERDILQHTRGFVARGQRGLVAVPPSTVRLELTAGMHPFSLLYANLGRVSGVFLRWRRPGEERFSPIPPEFVVHDPALEPSFRPPTAFTQGPKLLGSGTAFVVHPDGWLLTCHHVVDGAGHPSVRIGEVEWPATVVAQSAQYDLALLKIGAAGLAAIPLADVSSVKRQDEVLCFGYPLADLLGLDLSSENGRITALRNLDGRRTLQTNAPIKPGNSGGPMVNLRGEAVGVVSARLEVDGATEGVAFSVPIDYAAALLRRIPDFEPKFGGGAADLTPAEVDAKVSGAVFPVLVREQPVAAPATAPP
ncbi:MAG: trypsin-like peptidase domain-containing protein [Fimbriimonadaceae bacterium]|nr:trypsin-like peptidase domain-containing protein [Fimbriimonadaceae bacterium]